MAQRGHKPNSPGYSAPGKACSTLEPCCTAHTPCMPSHTAFFVNKGLEDQDQGRKNPGQVSQRPCSHCSPCVGLPLLIPSDLAKIRICLHGRTLSQSCQVCRIFHGRCGVIRKGHIMVQEPETGHLSNLDDAYWLSENLSY